MIPNISKFTRKFNKMAANHKSKRTNKVDKVRNLVARAKTLLSKKKANVVYNEKKANVVYNIPCKCKE